MIEAQVVVNRAWEYIPSNVREQWHELNATSLDSKAAHVFIEETLKPGLIRVYQAFAAQLKEKGIRPMEISGIYDCQSTILEALGLIEVYFTEFTSN